MWLYIIVVISDDTGLSVIHYVAAQWSVHVCRYLTSKGAQLDHCDQEGRTPLHIAAYFNHIDMIDYLLDNGGKILTSCLWAVMVQPRTH